MKLNGESVDASALLFPSGRSYTGQPSAELHLLGAPTLLAMVVEGCLDAGARRAEPGEFTARAFFAGRVDLSQAHGVAGMIAARSDLQLRAAERLLHGTLHQVATEAREELADLLSLVEGAMDFADEPIEFITKDALRDRLVQARARLAKTVSAGSRAERWGGLPRVVLVGRPNAGKSSLINSLSGADRAISAPIAGTTRDALAAPIDLGDGECLLMDVAGTTDVVPKAETPSGSIDAQARRMAEDAVRSADLLLVVCDLAVEGPFAGLIEPWLANAHACVVVGNKADIAESASVWAFRACIVAGPVEHGVVVSAKTGAGCDELRAKIRDVLAGRDEAGEDTAIALMAEHRAALDEAVAALDRAIGLTDAGDAQLNDADLVATELQMAASALGTLVGKDQTEEMLGRIFSRFCVGK